jgi:cell shape-determining protein MreC
MKSIDFLTLGQPCGRLFFVNSRDSFYRGNTTACRRGQARGHISRIISSATKEIVMGRLRILSLLCVLLAVPVLAEIAPQETDSRSTSPRSENDALRPDPRVESELARLRDEVAALKQALAEQSRLQDEIAALKQEIAEQYRLKDAIAVLKQTLTEQTQLKDEIAALRQGIAELSRLQAENATLRQELAEQNRLRAAEAKPAAEPGPVVRLPLPGQNDIDRMKAFIEIHWRRMLDIVAGLRQDILKKI